jgi:hypothetical protein
VVAGDYFWISVEPTAPIHDPQYNFGIHMAGARLIDPDTAGVYWAADGYLDGELVLPWRNGAVALVNRRTREALLLRPDGGPTDVRERAWPFGSLMQVSVGDTIEIRHSGPYNRFESVVSTFVVDVQSA